MRLCPFNISSDLDVGVPKNYHLRNIAVGERKVWEALKLGSVL